MKISTSVVATIALACALSVQAHDPSQHKNNGEKPRCKALEGLDPETVDRNDPVVQALLKKCEKQLHGEGQPKHRDPKHNGVHKEKFKEEQHGKG